MLVGLDVGGTHIDAVLLDAATGRCVASVKTATCGNDVLPGILEALRLLFTPENGHIPQQARRVTVSTTLGLNALLTGDTIPVGMLALPGPGLDIRLLWGDDPLFRVVPGALDHRGRMTMPPDLAALEEALVFFKAQNVRSLGIVCKFSPKNPELEQTLASFAQKRLGDALPVVLGSQVSGSLNFPRRLHTVWCNAALAAVSETFIRSLRGAMAEFGFDCPLYVLKADAGSFTADEARLDPASTMGSGPAASLLGVWALAGISSATAREGADTVMIDMGGTSTDLALLAGEHPLLAREGLTVNGRPTLIRTLWTKSLALGGDSSLRFTAGEHSGKGLTVGPDRSGPALAFDRQSSQPRSRPPTLTDALNVLGLTTLGDIFVSRAALATMADSPRCPAEASGNAEALSRLFVDAALAQIQDSFMALLSEVNAQPVYTIRELLVDEPLAPGKAFFIGGPARALAAELEAVLGMPVVAPEQSPFANALGAALALPTKSAELYADTLLGRMSIPDLHLDRSIPRNYTLQDAKTDILEALAAAPGAAPDGEARALPAQIVFAESFAVLDDAHKQGRILRIRAQRAAGLAMDVPPGRNTGRKRQQGEPA